MEHVKHAEKSYWKQTILYEKLDKLEVSLESRDNESDTDMEEDLMSEDGQIN